MPEIIVQGVASGKEIARLEVNPNGAEATLSLMEYLRSKKIPIASSCYGDGVCKRCKINGELLSCTITVEQFLDHPDFPTIKVDYI